MTYNLDGQKSLSFYVQATISYGLLTLIDGLSFSECQQIDYNRPYGGRYLIAEEVRFCSVLETPHSSRAKGPSCAGLEGRWFAVVSFPHNNQS